MTSFPLLLDGFTFWRGVFRFIRKFIPIGKEKGLKHRVFVILGFSVVGLSFDYVVYNIIGFLCYTAFNAAFFWSSSIQGQYEAQHHGDFEFSIHLIFKAIRTWFNQMTYSLLFMQ